MGRRRWISILALLGVLLHAGAVVRHNAVMTGATLQYHALLTDLAQLCHGGSANDGSAELPYLPKPPDAQSGCPLCFGLGSAVGLVTPQFVVAAPLPAAAAVVHSDSPRARLTGHAVCPPARGPPALA